MTSMTVYYTRHFFMNLAAHHTPTGQLFNAHQLGPTHQAILTMEADSLGEVFSKMQAENPAFQGGVPPGIHTSMSVGDIVVDEDTDTAWACAPFGWEKLSVDPALIQYTVTDGVTEMTLDASGPVHAAYVYMNKSKQHGTTITAKGPDNSFTFRVEAKSNDEK